jgi:cysteinyl-tRNA synthetase
MEYSEETVTAAQNGYQHLKNQVRTLLETAQPTEIERPYAERFCQTVNNDLNMPQAMALVQELLKSDLTPGVKLATLFDFDRVLGFNLAEVSDEGALPVEIEALAEARKKARKEKNWSLSDQLRDKIQNLGYAVQDTPQGMKVFKP